MVIEREIEAHFSKATVQASTNAFQFTIPLREQAGEAFGPKMDAAIREEYPPELAAKLVGKQGRDKVFDEPAVWEAEEGPEPLDPGYFVFATDIDWEAGKLRADYIPTDQNVFDMFFPSEEFLWSEFDDADYSASLEGMAFEKARIEMLLPNHTIAELGPQLKAPAAQRTHVGRPRKWDWEGALAYVTSQAQTPDGLPTGHGAQARIETMIAEWFEAETGGSPATSQIRLRASKVMGMIEKG